MKDLIQNARAVEARLRELEYEMQEDAADTIAELCTALEAAQKDAERYAYLREYGEPDKGLAYRSDFTLEMYDAAIDAAIKAQGDAK